MRGVPERRMRRSAQPNMFGWVLTQWVKGLPPPAASRSLRSLLPAALYPPRVRAGPHLGGLLTHAR
jgi:hypothetical protein